MTRARPWLALGLLCAFGSASFACIVIPSPPPPRPHPVPPGPAYLDVREQHITLSIEHPVVRTKVDTTLYNPHRSAVEGTFVFPLPGKASVTKFTFTMNNKPVAGEILPAEKARDVYLDIVRQMRDPALLEYSDGGMFTARLFPVPPGETSNISLEVLQTLQVDNNLVRYSHNVRVGRSEPPAKGKLVIEGRIHSQVPVKSVFSPTHDMDVSRTDDHTVKFSCELSDRPYDRDFVLYYGVAATELGFHVLTNRAPGEDGYFLLLATPEVGRTEQPPSKDIVFVIDTSGSMQGEKIDQARRALEYSVDTLRPDDRFALVSFATATRSLDDKLLPATKDNLARAKRFIADLEAVGGTALNEALVTACSLAGGTGDRPSYVLLFTDGRPTVGERDEARIVKNAGEANDRDGKRRGRLFIMGVGYDVNTRLIDTLTEGNGGASGYVLPNEDLEIAISSLVDKIGHPVLTDLSVKFEGAEVHDLQPAQVPDLFRGDQLSLVGRYVKEGKARVRIEGLLAGSGKRSWEWSLDLPGRQEENDFLPRLWATRQVGYLLDQIRLQGEDEELKREIVRLALKFGIVTPYTSYLVTEEEPQLAANRPGVRAAIRDVGGSAGGEAKPGATGAFGMPGAPAVARAREGLVGQPTGPQAIDAATTTAAMRKTSVATAGAEAVTNAKDLAGKIFYLDGESGYWVDVDYTDDLREVTVKYLSDVYLKLCRARPDIARWLAAGEKVKVRLGDVGLVVAEDVADNITDEQINTLGR